MLTITTLGGLSIRLDGEPVTGLASRKAEALLVYLACSERPRPREVLAELLWEERSQERAMSNLRVVLSSLRRQLGPYVTITRETASLNPEADPSAGPWSSVPGTEGSGQAIWLDAAELEEKLSAGQLEQAVALYHGDFLEGFFVRGSPGFEDWAAIERERLREMVLDALQGLVAHCLEVADYSAGVRHAKRLLELDPLMEEAHRQMMRLLASGGRRGAALDQYETCCQLLSEELGIEPTEETVALCERIRAGELETPAPAPELVPPAQLPAFLELEDEEEKMVERPVFVAREGELARLNEFLETALAGQGQVVFLSGGAGRGKTALMQGFARRALDAHPDMLVALGNCNPYSGVSDPYLPFRGVLGMLTGDIELRWAAGTVTTAHARRLWAAVPQAIQVLIGQGGSLVDIFIPGAALLTRAAAAAPGDARSLRQLQALIERNKDRPTDLAQQQLFDQYADVLRALSAQHPLLLLLDDLQWADTASTGLLFHLGRRLEGNRILIVGAYRPDEVALGRDGERHPLDKVLAEFKRAFGDIWIDLAEADKAEGRRFVDAFLETEPNRLDGGFRSGLFRHTGGHALFTVELLRAMQERGDLVQDERGYWVPASALDWEALPARVEAVIEERIGRLEDELREILTVASVEGEDFTAQVVARVQEINERKLLRTLSRELEKRHRLVREQGQVRVGRHNLSRYRFAHALFQQYLYNGMGAGERQLLHRATAEVLEELYGGRTEEIAVQLAHHWERAEEPEKATEHLLQAGDQARLACAHDEAIDYYERAAAYLKEQGTHERAARTLMKLGLVYHDAFDFGQARRAYGESFALWQRARQAQGEAVSPAPYTYRLRGLHGPRTLDPATARSGYYVIKDLFAGLVENGPQQSIIPAVARSWEVSEDGCQYVFHLREDWHWSDGTPVTAGDFEYAWKRALDPATRSGLPSLLHDVQGAEAFHKGEGKREDVGVRALDDVTLIVKLERPAVYFLQLLPEPNCLPVPRHVVEEHGEAWAEVGNIVTNGPFRPESWQPGESITLVRNPGYRGFSPGNLEEVNMFFALDEATELELYATDQLDELWGRAPHIDHVLRQHGGRLITLPLLNTNYIVFDVSRAPFDDLRVRRAFVLATDREALAAAYDGIPATGGFVPPGMLGHSPGISLPYDPERARRLLADAGCPGGRGFPEVRLVWGWAEAAEDLRACWRENLGVSVAWENVDWASYGEIEAHLFGTGWSADYPDPDNFLRVAVEVFQAYSRWTHPVYDSLVARARGVTNPRERMRLYRQADRILMEQAVILPLLHPRACYAVKPWVKPLTLLGGTSLGYSKDIFVELH